MAVEYLMARSHAACPGELIAGLVSHATAHMVAMFAKVRYDLSPTRPQMLDRGTNAHIQVNSITLERCLDNCAGLVEKILAPIVGDCLQAANTPFFCALRKVFASQRPPIIYEHVLTVFVVYMPRGGVDHKIKVRR